MSEIINKILVPTDFSETADSAVKTAIGLARKFKARLVILHVIDFLGYGSLLFEDDLQKPEEAAKAKAMERLDEWKSSTETQDIDLKITVRTGRVFRTILAESEHQQADMIVMGTHGLKGFDNLLEGSNTRRVVNLSRVPVLTVKDHLKPESVKNIAFASSFNQEYSLTFPSIYQFMESFRAKLHLLKVITPKEFEPTYYSNKIIKDFASSFLLADYQLHLVNAYTIEDGIDWACKEYNIDLLFMATHGRMGFAHLWAGSHTEKFGQQSSIPVFSIKMVKAKIPRGVIFPN
jgi:nucleotide-binding universal stress UspA family protein